MSRDDEQRALRRSRAYEPLWLNVVAVVIATALALALVAIVEDLYQ